jgi:membrane protease YdiL (CAAX protease family)
MHRRRATRAATLLLVGAAAGLATFHFAGASDSLAERFALRSLGVEIFLAAVALAGASLSRRPLRARLGLGPGRIPPRLVAVLVVGTIALSHALDGVLELSGLRGRSSLASFDFALSGAGGRDLVVALLGIGVAPGIAEELLFRGVVQRGLEARLGPALAIVLAAALFGALHGDLLYAASAGVLGIQLGLAAHLAGSTRAAIACHAANNLLAVAEAARWPWLGISAPATIAGGFALAAACLWIVDRRTAPSRLQVSREGGAPAAAPGTL